MARKKTVTVHGYKRTKQFVSGHERDGSHVRSYKQKRSVRS